MTHVSIRPAEREDAPFLSQMLYEAAYWRTNRDRPSLDEGLQRPDLARLLSSWGRWGDCALVAVSHGERVGAAWYRLWWEHEHSYGYVNNAIPEMTIGVRSDQRGQGIGRMLLTGLIGRAQRAGFERLSLSVEPDNRAVTLYQRLGFRQIAREGGAWTMLVELDRPSMVALREPGSDDLHAITKVHRIAFESALEPELVTRLVMKGHARISLAAIIENRTVGHVLFSHLPVQLSEIPHNHEGTASSLRALALAPVAVLPEFQGRGVAARLINEGLRRGRDSGYEALFVLGDPKYYTRFGFNAQLAAGFDSPYRGESFMGLELVAGSLRGRRGKLAYPEPFEGV